MIQPPPGYRLALRIFLPRDCLQVSHIFQACPKGWLISEAQCELGGAQFLDVFEPVGERDEVQP